MPDFDPPIYINCRDRVKDLKKLVAWLERAGHQRITLIDNDSSYEPLLDYLFDTPHEVVALGKNLGARALWHADLVPDEPFVYTDPDVIPLKACPLDLVARCKDILDRHPERTKVGPGLYFEDLGGTKGKDPEWDKRLPELEALQLNEIEPGVFHSMIDTTFALYPGKTTEFPGWQNALRLDYPYQLRCPGWYVGSYDKETKYYLDHAQAGPEFSSWREWTDAERKWK